MLRKLEMLKMNLQTSVENYELLNTEQQATRHPKCAKIVELDVENIGGWDWVQRMYKV